MRVNYSFKKLVHVARDKHKVWRKYVLRFVFVQHFLRWLDQDPNSRVHHLGHGFGNRPEVVGFKWLMRW